MEYCEIALGGVSNRGTIIPTIDVINYIEKAQIAEIELYRSYYSFPEEILEHFKKYKSVRSYEGPVELHSITFDIDKGPYKEEVLYLKLKEFLTKLVKEWKLDKDHMQVWFSGRGFHVSIPNIFSFPANKDTPRVVKATLGKFFPEADNIYDATRLLRVGNTINKKSKRYKIPLTLEEIAELTIFDVMDLAQEPRNDFEFPIVKEANYKTYPELIVLPSLVHTKLPQKIETNNYVTCMQKLYNRGPREGSRHTEMLRLASAYKRAGIPYKGIITLLSSWEQTFTEEEIIKIIDWVYKNNAQYSCSDPIFQKFCEPKCIFYKHKNYAPIIFNSKEMESKFTRFMRINFEGKSFDLSEFYKMDEFNFYPGELVIVIGDTKMGKSAWVQNICVHLDMDILYLSLEMNEILTYRRFIQIAHGLTKEEVMEYYKENDNALSEAISHIKVITTPPTISEIRKIISDTQPKIVVIDVIDAIQMKGLDQESKIGPIANSLKELAQQLDVIIIGIHHISKGASYTKLTIHSGKGSSSIEQKADKVIAIEGPRDTLDRTIHSLGSRDEHPFSIETQMSKQTFRFRQRI